jgi:hypothetical protein
MVHVFSRSCESVPATHRGDDCAPETRVCRSGRAEDPREIAPAVHGPHLPAISTVHAVLDRHGLVHSRRRRRQRATGTELSRPTEPDDLGYFDDETCRLEPIESAIPYSTKWSS